MILCGEINVVKRRANLFFREVGDMVGVQPEFDRVANINVYFVGGDFLQCNK
jgi:hypothetical protein